MYRYFDLEEILKKEVFIINITIVRANREDLEILHEMQIKSFKDLLEKYQDYEISPGNESMERLIEKHDQSVTTYWVIKNDKTTVGGVRVISGKDENYRVSPIFVLPSEQGKGVAQEVFRLLEKQYMNSKRWILDTILEEKGNCYLYEKLGYKKTGKLEEIKDGMTIVYYEKLIK